MKRTADILLRLIATVTALACLPALADERATSSLLNGHSAGELAALEQFLGLSDAQLDQLIDALQRVRAMTPEERVGFAKAIRDYRQLPGEQRRQIRDGWGRQSDASRDDWRRMMQALGPDERARIQAELQAADPDQRVQRRLEILEAWRAGE
jgi:hypothetical protein